MFGVGLSYPSSGGPPLLAVKSICLASNPVSFGSEARPITKAQTVPFTARRRLCAQHPSTAECRQLFPDGRLLRDSDHSAGSVPQRAAGLACPGQGDVSGSCKVTAFLEKAARHC